MAVAPSLGVGTPVNWPRKEPIAVRRAATMTTWMSDMGISEVMQMSPGTMRANHYYRTDADPGKILPRMSGLLAFSPGSCCAKLAPGPTETGRRIIRAPA
jgi:hypothetical protein